MNAIAKTLAAAALGALLLPAAARAQSTAPPTGITVVGTGTATVTDWVQEVTLRFVPAVPGAPSSYDACTAALASLAKTVQSAGLPAGAVTGSAVVYTSSGNAAPASAAPVAVARVQVPTSAVGHFMAAAVKDGWKETTRIVPRDPAAAKDSAYRAAFEDAKARAGTIAAADGRHVGRLLNVTPGFGDYLGSMMSSLASLADAFGKGSGFNAGLPEVTQSATFTFELVP